MQMTIETFLHDLVSSIAVTQHSSSIQAGAILVSLRHASAAATP